MSVDIEALGKKLDQMGWTLTYANDPVDGERIIVLDVYQVAGLVQDYEDVIASLKDSTGLVLEGPPPPPEKPKFQKKVAKF